MEPHFVLQLIYIVMSRAFLHIVAPSGGCWGETMPAVWQDVCHHFESTSDAALERQRHARALHGCECVLLQGTAQGEGQPASGWSGSCSNAAAYVGAQQTGEEGTKQASHMLEHAAAGSAAAERQHTGSRASRRPKQAGGQQGGHKEQRGSHAAQRFCLDVRDAVGIKALAAQPRAPAVAHLLRCAGTQGARMLEVL